MNFLKIKSIFSKDWVRDNDICLSILLIKNYVRDQIDPIDNKDKKEWIKSVCDRGSFLFTYNGIANKNPNSSYNIKQFW